MFAIVKTGGKQYRVSEGDTIRVEKLALAPGESLELKSLLGPASVTAQIVRHTLGEKIFIDKYKSGIQYRRRNGHRQQYTEIKITALK